MTKSVTFKADDEMRKKLRIMAVQEDTSVSELVKKILGKELERANLEIVGKENEFTKN